MHKFHNFLATQILREINVREFKSAKSVVFDFDDVLPFLRTEFLPKKFRAIKTAKMTVFKILECIKSISRKISVKGKF